ncbi:DUF3558 domain-containing protein [Gordonia bronchialis]|nr:DUF3558 domain-containing protein [Gordonia bronchialis]
MRVSYPVDGAVAKLMLVVGALASTTAVTACSVSGTAVGVRSSVVQSQMPAPDPIRQVDDGGRRLPFATTFPHRWSRNNDGTTYEPCTALSPAALQSLHLDPATAKDAAVADGQTARGCSWRYQGQRYSRVAQHVGNMNGGVTGISDYKLRNDDFTWFPDLNIGGRRVGLFSLGGDACDTIVESGRAFVFTDVALGRLDDDVTENCNRAIAFTRATIDLMPR